jgi:hypothetical protein
MNNSWENFSLVGIGLRRLNPMDLYQLPSTIALSMSDRPQMQLICH